MIRLAHPDITTAELDAVAAVLRSGYLVQGDRVREFERLVAAYTGARYAVAVSSGTAALHLALMALDLGPGDQVAVPCYSWPATANVVALCGADPVFVDVLPDTYNIDPAKLEATLRACPAIKAIMPVHAFGGMADMAAIAQLSSRFRVPVIEDAACALGAVMGGRSAGHWGTMGCFSFHPRKIVTTGEGGMVVTDDAGLDARIRALRNHGLDPHGSAPDFVIPGLNYRLTEIQAALGVPQLQRLRDTIESRRSLARTYAALLRETDILAPIEAESGAHTYQAYVVLLPPAAAERRDAVLATLRAHGVEATIGTYHIPGTTYFRHRYGIADGDFPVSHDVARRAVALPLHRFLTEADQQYVVRMLRQALSAPGSGDGLCA